MTISSRVPGWKIYLSACLLALPALVTWVFDWLFIMPKCRQVWEWTGLSPNPLLEVIAAIGYSGFLYFHFILIAVILVVLVVDRLSKGSTLVRRWLTGTLLFVFNLFVFGAVLCQVVLLSVASMVIHKRSTFLADYVHGAGVFSAARERWTTENQRFPLVASIDQSDREEDRLNVLLDILTDGETVGVRRGVVGTLLDGSLRFSPIQLDRFLTGLTELQSAPFTSLSDVQAWYPSVADDPTWQSVSFDE